MPHATCHLPHVWQVWLKWRFSEAPVCALRCDYVTLTLPSLALTSRRCVQRVNCSCLSYVRTQQIAVAPPCPLPPTLPPSVHVIKCQCSWCAIPRDYPSHKCLRGRHSCHSGPCCICAATPHKSARDIIRYSLTDYSNGLMAKHGKHLTARNSIDPPSEIGAIAWLKWTWEEANVLRVGRTGKDTV